MVDTYAVVKRSRGIFSLTVKINPEIPPQIWYNTSVIKGVFSLYLYLLVDRMQIVRQQ